MIVKEHHGEIKAYDIRQATGPDIGYITNSWLMAYKMSPEQDMPGRTNRDYYHYNHRKLEEIIPRASRAGSCYICHVADKPDEFRGYMVAEAFEDFPPIVHWVQVKKEHKNQGVAGALLDQFFLDFDLDPDALIYTFSSHDMKRRGVKFMEKLNARDIKLLYLPDMKSTLNRPGWEA